MGDTAQVNCLGSVGIDFLCLSAVANRVTVVLSVVSANRHVLKNGHLQFVEFRRVVLHSFRVGQCILVLTFCKFKASLLELDVSKVLKVRRRLDQLRVAHHPPSWASVSDAHELNVKDQGSFAWDRWRRAHCTVAVLRLDRQLSLFTQLHGHDSEIPSLNHLTNADVDFESLLVDRAIKYSSVFKSTCVVNQDLLTLLDIRAIFSDLRDLLNDAPVVR